ncbi:MAG: hypothetical protein WC901_00805 [Candidatus Margulisiibacteriota bacterium]
MTKQDAKKRVKITSLESPLIITNCGKRDYVNVGFANTAYSVGLVRRNNPQVIGVFSKENPYNGR